MCREVKNERKEDNWNQISMEAMSYESAQSAEHVSAR